MLITTIWGEVARVSLHSPVITPCHYGITGADVREREHTCGASNERDSQIVAGVAQLDQNVSRDPMFNDII